MDSKSGKPTTVDEYIAQFPEDLQQILLRIRSVIKENAPDAVEKISYNMPAYKLNGNLVFFSVSKRHIGIYPMTPGMEDAIEGLAAYRGTKSSIHFQLDKPVPYELLSEIVKYRVAENHSK